MTKKKKILLSLLMCGFVCNTAYAETYEVNTDTTWNVPEEHAELTAGDTVTIGNAATLTINSTDGGNTSGPIYIGYHDIGSISISGNGSESLVLSNDESIKGHGDGIYVAGASDGNGNYSTGNSITVENLASLTVSGFSTAVTAINNGNMYIGTAENPIGKFTLTGNNEGINLEGQDAGTTSSHLTIYATEFINEGNGISGSTGINIGWKDTEAFVEKSEMSEVNITADTVTVSGFYWNIFAGDYGRVMIDNTGAGKNGVVTITDFDYAGIETGGFETGNNGGLIDIKSDGTINIISNCSSNSTSTSNYGIYGGATGGYFTDGNGSYWEGVHFESPNKTGILNITNSVNNIADTGAQTGRNNGIAPIKPYSVNIIGFAEVNFLENYRGIYNAVLDTTGFVDGTNGVNILDAGKVTFKDNIDGIRSKFANGVNITTVEGGEVVFEGNKYGIDASYRENAVNINSDNITFIGNAMGMDLEDGAGVNFETKNFTATGGENVGYTCSYNGGTSMANDPSLDDDHIGMASSIEITADKMIVTGQKAGSTVFNFGIDKTFWSEEGGSIILKAGNITAQRADDGYIGYVDNKSYTYTDENTETQTKKSLVDITADTGTITGAFWADDFVKSTGENSDGVTTVELQPEATGIINLDLGESTDWNITADSAVTNLTLGDASTMTFSYLGDTESGSGPFMNLYTDSFDSGSGSTINMNINANALNDSDHIYINDTHTGTSVINLNANGSDLSETVLGTILVSVNSESGSFTAGSGTKGTYEGALYNWNYTIAKADKNDDSTRYISKTGTYMNMDNYNYDWYLTDFAVETDSPDSPNNPNSPDDPDNPNKPNDPNPDDGGNGGDGGDPGPGPAQPNPGGGGTPTTTTTVEAIKAANAVNYYAFREQDKLLRRMGELRNNGEDEQGVWIRVKGAKTGRHASFENKYVHYEGGYDHLVKNDHREKRYEGFSLSHTEGDVKYKEVTGSGKAHDEEIAFYRVDQYTHGHYLDLVTRIGIYNNRFGVYDTNQNKIHGKNHNYGISTSAEYGRKKDYAHDWYVEPQGQATLGYLSGNEYITSNNVNVSNGSISSAVGRIGVNIGKGFTDKNGRRGKFYAKANWLKEFLGSYGIDMTTENSRRHAHGNYKDTWFEWGFGFTYQYTKNNFFYADVEKSQGSAYYKNWAWNVGLRWTFN